MNVIECRWSRLLGSVMGLALVGWLAFAGTAAVAAESAATDQPCSGEDCDLPMTKVEPQAPTVDNPSVAVIEQIVHDYLLAHPEVLVESLQAWQAQQAENAKVRDRHLVSALADEIYLDESSPVTGREDATLTIVEFFDYQCGYCRHVAPLVAQLLDENTDLRLVYKEFPVLGPESVLAARAALAARAQDKYSVFHDALMAAENSLSQDSIMAIAKSAGLDVEQLARDMDDPEIDAILARNYRLARRLDIRGTPAFVFNGELIRGAPSYAMLSRLVTEARKQANSADKAKAASEGVTAD